MSCHTCAYFYYFKLCVCRRVWAGVCACEWEQVLKEVRGVWAPGARVSGCWELNGSSGKSTHALNPCATSAPPGYLFLAESLRNWFFCCSLSLCLRRQRLFPISAPALRSPQFLLSTFSPSTQWEHIQQGVLVLALPEVAGISSQRCVYDGLWRQWWASIGFWEPESLRLETVNSAVLGFDSFIIQSSDPLSWGFQKPFRRDLQG